MSMILLFIGTTLMYSSPLVFGAMAGVISERSGVINIGIEGMMTIGAFVGAATGVLTGNVWLGFLAGGLAGMGLSLLHAIAAVSFKADQTISGIALNLIGPGLALFLCGVIFNGAKDTPTTPTMPKVFDWLIDPSSPWINLNISITVLLALLLVLLVWFFLYKTRGGLHVRSVGEHAAAADTLGINVTKTRYLCVLASGLFAGFGGATMTMSVISQFSPLAICGQGYIALAAVIFGKWKPIGAYGACLLFGAAQAVTVVLGGDTLPFTIPPELLSMIPYVLTIVVLILFVGKSAAPKEDGIPYRKGSR